MALHTTEWKRLIRFLRKEAPVAQKVRIRRRPIGFDDGWVVFNGSDYLISINSRLPWSGQVDALLHEWAHVCAIEEAYRHKGRWGQIHGDIYEAWSCGFNKER